MDMNKLMQQAQQMQQRMQDLQASLADERVEAESGGGMVKVVFNGQQELVKISVDSKLVAADGDGNVDIEMLEDLIVAAVSKGLEEVVSWKALADSIGRLCRVPLTGRIMVRGSTASSPSSKRRSSQSAMARRNASVPSATG